MPSKAYWERLHASMKDTSDALRPFLEQWMKDNPGFGAVAWLENYPPKIRLVVGRAKAANDNGLFTLHDLKLGNEYFMKRRADIDLYGNLAGTICAKFNLSSSHRSLLEGVSHYTFWRKPESLSLEDKGTLKHG